MADHLGATDRAFVSSRAPAEQAEIEEEEQVSALAAREARVAQQEKSVAARNALADGRDKHADEPERLADER